PAAAAPRPPEPPTPPPPPPARPATVLRKPTTLRPPSSRAVPAIPALAPTSPSEETREPRELGFRIKPKARPVRRLRDVPPWARKVLVGFAVVAFYFGARALNRYRVSFAARDAAIEALIPLMGLD